MNGLNFDSLPDVLTAQEAAKVLRIGRSAVYEGIRTRNIPSIRLGRRLLVPKVALQRLLSSTGIQSD